MTTSRRDARICLTVAVLSFASGVYAAVHTTWLCLFGFYAAAFFAWCTARLYADDRRELEIHERARRAALVDDLVLQQTPVPCCSFWRHSAGAVHSADCPDSRSAA
ncbi:hypothetical protein [Streptomyces justiciae]|uniref:Uncharacterized protein n=1 Tax=Streptomyces justiciae TaxID=2780140 RepID=A0ABU3M6T9_9ACTN|nr:hypothetical protein [Streptomyces justiciae]MDT7847236.1 hypothetical protein [Streptomyces justiciae]